MKRTVFAVVLAVMAATASWAYAHHSFAATYIEDKEITIEGDLVTFMYRNPHSFLHLMAFDKADKTKTVHRYAVEWGGGGQLNRQGVTRDTLKAGDHVIITGSPGRNPADHRLRMKSIFRPKDGWKWSGVVE
jgi:hypothetical protein